MIGKCTECGQPCNIILLDIGIGAYEYWGSKEYDIQIEAVSDCCEAPAVDINNNLITEKMVADQEKAANYY